MRKDGVKSKHLDLTQGITVLDDGSSASPRININKLRVCIEELLGFLQLPSMAGEAWDIHWMGIKRQLKSPQWRLAFSSFVSRLIDIEKGR